MRRLLVCLVFTVAWGIAAFAAAPDKAPPPTAKGPQPLADRVLGKANAPVTVVEYASLTCIHCSAFNADVMPTLKKEYVETGKVRYVYRDFPMDGLALRGAMLARCLPEKRYFGFVDTLFRQRDQWLNDKGDLTVLRQLAALAGLGAKQADACLANKALEEGLIQQRLHASNFLHIEATPTLLIGGEKLQGEQTVAAMRTALDKALKKAVPAAPKKP